MRVKTLERDGSRKVLLVYPTTLDEYGRALEALGHDPARAARGPEPGRYVVTTEEQRRLWGLPDLSAAGRARVMGEAQAFGALCDPAEWSAATAELPAEAVPPPGDGEPDAVLAAVRALAAPGPRVDRVLAALDDSVLPGMVQEVLRRTLQESLASGGAAVEPALDRAAMAVDLPWRTHAPARFDRVRLREVLDRTHAGLDRVKGRLVEVLAASRGTGGFLTVECPSRVAADDVPSALVVRPRAPRTPARIPCLAGPAGTGRRSLSAAVAEALGRPHVRATLHGDASARIRGNEDAGPGRIVEGLLEAGARNPVFLLEALDRVEPDAADALLDVLDPERGKRFRDRYLRVSFDLSAVLWIVTATDAGAIPEPVRDRLEVIELPGYTEQEKLAIAERHLLQRPFGPGVPGPAACLAPEPAAASPGAGPDAVPGVPVTVAEHEVSSPADLEALTAEPPLADAAPEAWRTAASSGAIRFERDAVREVIRGHTDEAGVTELTAKLALVCRRALARRPPGARALEVVTPAVVRDVLGEGTADRLSPAVRDAIARERRRLGDGSESGAERTNDWIGCWKRCRGTGVRRPRSTSPASGRRSTPGTRASATPRRASSSTWPYAGGTRSPPAPSSVSAGRQEHGRGARARVRQAPLRRAPRRDRPARPQPHLAGRPARLHPPRAAAGPYPRPRLRARRDRQARPRARRRPARGPRPRAERSLPRRLHRAPLRPLGGALHHHGQRPVPDPARAARPARDHRAARLRRGREARHRRDAPRRGQEPGRRADGGAGPGHPGRLPAHHPRLHERAGNPAVRAVPAADLPEGRARARDGRRVARPHAHHGGAGARVPRRAGGRPRGRPRPSPRAARGIHVAGRRADSGAEVLARLDGMAISDPDPASGRESCSAS